MAVATASLATAGTTANVDRTFAGDGVASLNARGNDFSFAVVPDGSHYYLVGGTEKSANADCAFLAAKYGNRGRLDTSFGDRGVKTLAIGKTSCATDATLMPDGRLLVSGWSSTRRDVRATLAVFRPNGTLDRDFAGDGIFLKSLDGGIASPRVQVEPDGSIWFAWSEIRNWDKYYGKYQIAHIHPNGRLDSAFGQRGIRSFAVRDVNVVADTGIDSSGRLIVAGWSARTLKDPGLTALISVDNGEPTFQRTVNQWSAAGTFPISVDATPSGDVVVATTPDDRPGWGAARLDDRLRFDDTFSGNGMAEHACDCGSNTGVATPNGGVILVGSKGRSDRTVLAGFTPAGRWDRQLAQFGPWNAVENWEVWHDAVLDDSGDLLLAGRGKQRTVDALIARINLN